MSFYIIAYNSNRVPLESPERMKPSNITFQLVHLSSRAPLTAEFRPAHSTSRLISNKCRCAYVSWDGGEASWGFHSMAPLLLSSYCFSLFLLVPYFHIHISRLFRTLANCGCLYTNKLWLDSEWLLHYLTSWFCVGTHCTSVKVRRDPGLGFMQKKSTAV